MNISSTIAGPATPGAAPEPGQPHTHETVPTAYLDVNGVKVAYRSFGKADGPPLVFLQHFTGTMDNWDPLVTNALANDHRVILFDNVGVGSSDGETPTNVARMAQDAVAFLQALGLEQVDLLGFSLGNYVAQQIAMDHPQLVRRLVLVGGGPAGQGAENYKQVIANIEGKSAKEALLYLFFEPSDSSQQSGEQFLQRLQTRTAEPARPTTQQTIGAQYQAIVGWGDLPDPDFDRLKRIKQPVLVVQGRHDIMMPTVHSILLFQHLPNAQLSLYPDSGHGSLFQHARLFAEQAAYFLRAE
ncbi:alpha/beta fold hydrolase [Hymenobacter terricola]|uniref:alpha/beta fold hydrolase n=1 Tax=Hymenobacter terricola TaxID=2819236 RepID=UPI001B306D4E|nr:alpha/beta hydrolase [Hymenobacter terricola]